MCARGAGPRVNVVSIYRGTDRETSVEVCTWHRSVGSASAFVLALVLALVLETVALLDNGSPENANNVGPGTERRGALQHGDRGVLQRSREPGPPTFAKSAGRRPLEALKRRMSIVAADVVAPRPKKRPPVQNAKLVGPGTPK